MGRKGQKQPSGFPLLDVEMIPNAGRTGSQSHGTATPVLLHHLILNSFVSWRHKVRSRVLFYVVMVNLLVLLCSCHGKTLCWR